MEAELYKVVIYEGSIAHVHGMGEEIQEIWISQIQACFNEKGGAFRNNKPRSEETTNIKVAFKDVLEIDQLIYRQERIAEIKDRIFKDNNTAG